MTSHWLAGVEVADDSAGVEVTDDSAVLIEEVCEERVVRY